MKTVFNENLKDPLKQPLFLGEDLGIQRYDIQKYPIFEELYCKQEEFRWRPEEVSLVKDRNDYNDLSEAERFVFDSNIKFQTLGDSMLSRSILSLTPYVSNTELEACCNTWSNFEIIHSRSYSWIFRNLFPNPDKFFDSILEDKEIVKRKDLIKSSYDAILGADSETEDIKDRIYKALISTNVMEGLVFYISFACSFYFGYRGLMEGGAKIIKLISRDEACITEGAECLTPTGWKEIKNLTENDLIAQFNQDRSIEFVKPQRIIKKDYEGKVINFSNVSGHVDMTLTPDHRVIYEKNEVLRECPAEDLTFMGYKYIPLAGYKKDGKSELTWNEKFMIAFQADGSFRHKDRSKRTEAGEITVVFGLRKERKVVKLEEILKEIGFRSSKSFTEKSGYYFYVHIPEGHIVSKYFKDWVDISDKNYEWCQNFILEMTCWDGHRKNGDDSHLYYSTTSKDNADVVQAISACSGWRCHRSIQVGNRKESYSDVHRLKMVPGVSKLDTQSLSKEYLDYIGKVYCVTVDSGMFIARQNGKPFVTGNCHFAITQNILKILRDVPSEGFQDTVKKHQDLVYETYRQATTNEIEWAGHLFSKGGLLGLNEESLGRYCRWLADSRLRSLGYKKALFGEKTNPLSGWLDSFMDSSKVQVAPQETEITAYKIGAQNTTIDMKEFEDCDL